MCKPAVLRIMYYFQWRIWRVCWFGSKHVDTRVNLEIDVLLSAIQGVPSMSPKCWDMGPERCNFRLCSIVNVSSSAAGFFNTISILYTYLAMYS